jgi:hypothetical protein
MNRFSGGFEIREMYTATHFTDGIAGYAPPCDPTPLYRMLLETSFKT